MASTPQDPVNGREVLRCGGCDLVQFRGSNGLCRRCHISLDGEQHPDVLPEEVSAPQLLKLKKNELQTSFSYRLTTVLKEIRLRNGLSQWQLGERVGASESFISRMEARKFAPGFKMFIKMADALNMSCVEIVALAEEEQQSIRSKEMTELCKDPFIAEIAALAPLLTDWQRTYLLSVCRDPDFASIAKANLSPWVI